MHDFLNNYRRIANETSGLITLGALQLLLLAVVIKRGGLFNSGLATLGFWFTIIISFGGFILTGAAILNTVIKDSKINSVQRGAILSVFMVAFFAALFSALIGVKSL
ncbi:hypothetical protein ACCW76_18765 [Pantoea sp. C8B4]|uniref:hypothetical protein n=1 Tax=Pantoea sp. C8B4 TaxID=3243083 RepID=UPI003ED8B5AB